MEPMILFFTITRRNVMINGQKHPFLKANEWFRIFGSPGSITSISILANRVTVEGSIFRTAKMHGVIAPAVTARHETVVIQLL